ncbi:MAN2A1 [Branchiostoma lanceolatum]|uniref:Alpha-mannosidase n=1 Tax=Branchiostoma lanceolatum TaxID=7740 RepID=A0A8K0EJS5_BRALA|nr:MAN2A1 [Branchiostoma lanceolatum]CAH1251352.1 MAN2A1 [Branchiostoma lanceolatum]
MKKYVALFGSCMFLVAFFSMYLMLDQLNLHGSLRSRVSMEMGQTELDFIKDKMENLENDIHHNQQIIDEIRNSVKQIIGGENMSKYIPVQRNMAPLVEEVPDSPVQAKIETGDCSFVERQGEHSDDVQMLDVLDILPFDNPDGGVWKQGFDIRYTERDWDNQPLKVFVVPHSHNDPGWIKTVDRYYLDQTQHILNNMVDKLKVDSRRKFIWAEISFFSMWWDNIDAEKKDAVKKLVENGQLEIVTGGWVMSDEAITHYYAMIDQMIEGHEWIKRNLGIKPRSGWAIDPFGHSPTMAYLLKRMGLQNMVVQRVHYSVKKQLAKEKQLEFMWRQNWDHGASSDMLCHMMPFYSYDVPHTCGPDPKVCCQFDFKRLPGGRVNCPWKVPPVPISDNNVAERAKLLLDQYRKKSKLYRSNIVLIPLGDDFRYDKAIEWDQQYGNYQKLFDYMNSQNWHVEAQFGTLSDYFDAMWDRAGLQPGSPGLGYPVLSGDFFSYADREDHYWSGYYTSRPFYKNLDRVLEAHARAAEIIFSLALAHSRHIDVPSFPAKNAYQMLIGARKSLGLFQHHDAITGTAKDFVVVDYGTRLLRSIMDMKRVMIDSAHFLMSEDKSQYDPETTTTFFDMDEKRINHDALPEKPILQLSQQTKEVVFYNSVAQARHEVVRLRVSSSTVEVQDASGKVIPSQTNLVWTAAQDSSTTEYELVFIVNVPPLGLSKYLIRDAGSEVNNPYNAPSQVTLYNTGSPESSVRGVFHISRPISDNRDFTIENSRLRAKFSGTTGLLQSVTTVKDGKETAMSVEFLMYGTRETKKDKSGAYLFLPDGEAKTLDTNGKAVIRVIRGKILSEVHVLMKHVEHVITLHRSPGIDGWSLEISNVVDIRDQRNRELCMRLKTDIKNSNQFFSDLNGFQMQRRKTLSKLPLQANYYPMSTMAYLQDQDTRMTIHTAQSLGVGSLQEGWLEVMLDRRLNQDDNRGLQQGLLDNKRTPNQFRLLLERRHQRTSSPNGGGGKQTGVDYPSLTSHSVSQLLNHPVYAFIRNKLPGEGPAGDVKLSGSVQPLVKALPCDIHFVNLRTVQAMDAPAPTQESVLLLHRKGFDCSFPANGLSCSTTGGKVQLEDLFRDLDLTDIKATSLSLMYDGQVLNSKSTLQLDPMEINAYRIRLD